MTPKSFYYPSATTPSPTLWQPSDLSGLVAYYTTQDASSLDVDVSNNVTTWRPQYGETNWDLLPVGTIGYDPTGLNGLPSVEAFANANYLQTTNVLNIDSMSIALALNYTNVDRQGFFAGNNKGGIKLYDFFEILSFISNAGNGGDPPILGYTGGSSVLMLPMYTYDDVNQLLTGNLNGTDVGIDTPRTNLTGVQESFRVFASSIAQINQSTQWGTQMGAVIVTDNYLSLDEREKIQGFLAHDWNLTDLLPIDHPYKNDPPMV